jgi:hypothetical protein
VVDTRAQADALFLFESKVMAVLERGISATSERRAKVTTKHFKQALGQRIGAVTTCGLPTTATSAGRAGLRRRE